MKSAGRLVAVRGTVSRILGSHDTTDVQITEHSTTRYDSPTDHGTSGVHISHARTETHTFVNTQREFVMLLEVDGRTLRLASDDYIALAPGDEVHAVCRTVHNGPLLVRDWNNVTRSIRFRTVPTPLDAAAKRIVGALVSLTIAVGCAINIYFYGSEMAVVGFVIASIVAAILAPAALRKAHRMARLHAELDRLALQ